MLNTLAKISDCIGLPYFILGCLSLTILVAFNKKKKKAIIFIFFISVIWRSAFHILSSRYCAIFLLLIPYIILIFSNRLRNIKAGAIVTVITFLIIYNCLETFLSFNNLYIYDAKEKIDLLLSSNGNNSVMIAQKELYRLKKKNGKNQFVLDSSLSKSKPLFDFLCQEKWWNKSIYWIDYCNQKNETSFDYFRQFDLFSIKQICSLITSTKKNKRLSFYKIDSKLPEDTEKIQHWLKNNASLESYSPLYNTYVFCNKKKIFWFIGFPIEDKTQIMYHLYTNEPNLLPENRIKYGYENRGFYKNKNNYKEFDSYIVFEKEIPEDYPIEKIVVGLYINGTVTWRDSIILSNAL